LLPLFDNVPTRRFPLVNYSLIAANFAVWAWELGSRTSRINHDAFYPCSISGPCLGQANHHLAWPEGVLTGMFLHATWLHILGNMLFLWIFGNNVEDLLGRLRYLGFYLAAGYVAAFTQTWVTVHFAGGGLEHAQAASIPNVGASGAIAGVLGAYFVLLPRARVTTLIFIFPWRVYAWVFLGIWFALELWQANFSLTHPAAGGGVAFGAHVGGFVFGALTARFLQVRKPLAGRSARRFRPGRRG
jgi:membrane associated rhomboid family serine protease